MVALTKQNPSHGSTPAWHAPFLGMLPAIVMSARMAFRNLQPDARQEAIQEVIANCLVAFCRLVDLGKAGLAYAGPLAWYAIRQFRAGRRIGARLNIHDVASPYARQRKGIVVRRLDAYDPDEEVWQEILVEAKTATPADLAASRIDFPAWLNTLCRRNRKIALTLAEGETTKVVARRFQLAPSRVSQLRKEFQEHWRQFHGEGPQPEAATGAAA